MPNVAYEKGVRFEREVINAFKALGCHATRSAGSHGPWDVTIYTDKEEARKKAYRLLNILDCKTPPRSLFDWEYNWQGDETKKVYFTIIEAPSSSVWLIQCKRLCP